jgi:fructokinase
MPAFEQFERVDVMALGELVIDLIPVPPVGGASLFSANPGGAPGNVAAGIARLGLVSGMISKVGPGTLGDLLIETLTEAGVETAWIARSATEPTALAVVSVADNGDRDFILYRHGCADANLAVEDLPLAQLRTCRILHVGSLSLATPFSAAAQRRAVALVRESGGMVSADVNFRPALWCDLKAMRATGVEAVDNADIVKVSAEELQTLTGSDEIDAGAEALWHPRLKLLAVTRSEAGAVLFTPRRRVEIAGLQVPVVNTVGCGDAFMAALLAGLLEQDIDGLDETSLRRIGHLSCAAGAVMASSAGAMASMPRRPDIEALIARAASRTG